MRCCLCYAADAARSFAPERDTQRVSARHVKRYDADVAAVVICFMPLLMPRGAHADAPAIRALPIYRTDFRRHTRDIFRLLIIYAGAPMFDMIRALDVARRRHHCAHYTFITSLIRFCHDFDIVDYSRVCRLHADAADAAFAAAYFSFAMLRFR